MSTYHIKLSYEELSTVSIISEGDKQYDHVVIIPAYGEADITSTLGSLDKNVCQEVAWSVLVLINEGVDVTDQIKGINIDAFEELQQKHYHFDLFVLYVSDIPAKWAGVGLARKIAIDQATIKLKSTTGSVINLDADCIVSEHYIKNIDIYFKNNPKIELANFYFEHRTIGDLDSQYIFNYELHLRYMIAMQRWLKLPFAYHTVGSSFAVRGGAYHQVGGMNKKKAGEDFYFIHKFSKKGTVGYCNSAKVYPSDRISERVPFGTGRAILQMSEQNVLISTYHIDSFMLLKDLLFGLPDIYRNEKFELKVDARLIGFLKTVEFDRKVDLIRNNVRSFHSFIKSFFQWFDAFMLMKYLHYMRDQHIDNVPVVNAALDYLHLIQHDIIDDSSETLLDVFRTIDVNTEYNGLNEVMALFSGY